MIAASEMSLVEIENEIESTYRWWHDRKPGVTPKEHGRLAELWRRADYLIWKGRGV